MTPIRVPFLSMIVLFLYKPWKKEEINRKLICALHTVGRQVTTNLHSRLLTVVDIRYHNRCFDVFEERNETRNLAVKLVIANRL